MGPVGAMLPGKAERCAAPPSECVQESDVAHPGRSTSAVIPRPGHAVACFHARGCRAEESTVGLLEGRRGSPCLLRGYDTGGQGQCRSGTTGHQQQTVDFPVGAQEFVRSDGAVWRLLRNDIRARAQEILEHTLRITGVFPDPVSSSCARPGTRSWALGT